MILLVLSGVASAREAVRLPLSCEARAGRVALKPSISKLYDIVNVRERQVFTACAPEDPGRCRSIMLHRFDLACGTETVPWVDVAAALITDQGGQAWTKQGRLYIARAGRPGTRRSEDCADAAAAPDTGQRAASSYKLEERLPESDCGRGQRSKGDAAWILPPGFAPVGELGANLVLSIPGRDGPQAPPPRTVGLSAAQPASPPPMELSADASQPVRKADPAQAPRSADAASTSKTELSPAAKKDSAARPAEARAKAESRPESHASALSAAPPPQQAPAKPQPAPALPTELALAEPEAMPQSVAPPSVQHSSPTPLAAPFEPPTTQPAIIQPLPVPFASPALAPASAPESPAVAAGPAAEEASSPDAVADNGAALQGDNGTSHDGADPADAEVRPVIRVVSGTGWSPSLPPARQGWMLNVEPSAVVEILVSHVKQLRLERELPSVVMGIALVSSFLAAIGWFASRSYRVRPRPVRVIRLKDPESFPLVVRPSNALVTQDAQMCGELCTTAHSLLKQIDSTVDELQGVAPLRRVLQREMRHLEQFLTAVTAASPAEAEEWRRMRNRLQRIVKELMRLKEIVEGAYRSLSGPGFASREPRDRNEAMEALGVNADASPKTVKKLVEALRACWHPDLAKNEADRLMREERMKRINIAWDILNAKRQEA